MTPILAVVVVASPASSVFAQQSQPQRYLPPNVPRPAAASAPAASAPAGAATPSATVAGSPSTAAGQLRLMGPDGPASVNFVADPVAAPPPAAPPGSGVGVPDRRGPQDAGSDPTAPHPDLRRLIEGGNETRNAVAGPPPLPEIRIRARVFARNKPPVAIIEVGGKPLTVRMGSEIQVPSPGGTGSGLQLKVTELNLSELHIEVVDRKQTIYLN